MQAKRVRPGDAPALAGGIDQLREAFAPRLEGPRELVLLRLDAGQNLASPLRELRVGASHDVDDHPARLGQEGAVDTHQPAVPNRPTHDPTQDVPGSVVRRSDSFANQKGHGPRVVRDHLVAESLALDGVGIVTDELREPLDDGHEQIGLVVRVDALQDRGGPLQAHPGVHALERQGRQRPVRGAVVLHEHKVPELEIARAGLGVIRDAVGALAELGAAVVVDLATRPAGAGLGHLPEVVIVPDRDIAPARDALEGHADLLRPDLERLLVIGIDRGRQALLRDAKVFGKKLPCPADRLALEVVAKAPIAEHLEERLVARSAPDLLEVVVLAGYSEAGLCVDRPAVPTLLLTGQHALELDHAGVNEEQGGVVAGEQRGCWHPGVATRLEEALKSLAKLGCGDRLHRTTGRHAPIHQESRRLPAPLSIDECGSVSGLGGPQLATRGSRLGTGGAQHAGARDIRGRAAFVDRVANGRTALIDEFAHLFAQSLTRVGCEEESDGRPHQTANHHSGEEAAEPGISHLPSVTSVRPMILRITAPRRAAGPPGQARRAGAWPASPAGPRWRRQPARSSRS